MKKFSKLFVVLALCLVAVFALAACGGTSVVGDWVVEKAEVTYQGETEDMTAQYKSMTLSIKEDGKCTSSANGQTMEGTWKQNGSKLTITDDKGTSTVFTVSNGKLVAEDASSYGTLKLTLKKK